MKLLFAVIILLFIGGCAPHEHDTTKKPDYYRTSWLNIEGNVSKGYKPYLALTYHTWQKECRLSLSDNYIAGFFLDPIIRIFLKNYDGKKAGEKKRIYDARLREDRSYSLRYPKNFFIDRCEYALDTSFLMLREEDESASLSETQYDDENDTLVLRYYVINYQESNRNIAVDGTYDCQAMPAKKQHSSKMQCEHRAEDRENRFYFYPNELKKNNRFQVDIVVNSNIQT